MKNAQLNANARGTRGINTGANKRPENKDNLDSREGEEQQRKGDDITHNKKEKKGEAKKK